MKALALFSGGLDSMLAIRLIKNQGIDVLAIHISTGFGATNTNYELMKKRANEAGAEFLVVDIRQKYIDVLLNPKYGYGKAFNPCIDCHGFMFKTALSMLDELKADFIITGEVIGQRPMSQRKEALNSVKKLSGEKSDLILRPLCAKNLAPTTPELKGWVDRDRLESISGRGRSRQIELAKEFGFSDYESPAGGCLLTLANFGDKIKEHLKNGSLEVEDIELLKHGRHLRLDNGAKMIVGRNEEENEILAKNINDKFLKLSVFVGGALSLLEKNASEEDIKTACKVALTYAKTTQEKEYEVEFNGKKYVSKPFLDKKEVSKYFIIK